MFAYVHMCTTMNSPHQVCPDALEPNQDTKNSPIILNFEFTNIKNDTFQCSSLFAGGFFKKYFQSRKF